jgi:hypothetical protein
MYMDPKVLFLVPGLVAGSHGDHARPSVRSLTPPTVPVYEWPEREDYPESDYPAHEDPSPMYRGMVYSNINVSNTTARFVTVDSSASASGVHVPPSMWPENNLIIVDSVGALGVSERVRATPRNLEPSPNASKHLCNPSTIRIRESITRRRG